MRRARRSSRRPVLPHALRSAGRAVGRVAGEGVTAVDLGTRIVDAAEAAARTRRAAGVFAGAELLIKTVDSTLRGHVAAELRAALAGSGRRAAIVAPAFPGEGRTTVEGVQYVRGVRVDESEFARDPAHPVRTADLARVLPEAVLVGPDGLPDAAGKGGVLVCSAATDADLDAIVAAVPRPDEVLWVGSPGLADALARRHSRHPAAALSALPPVKSPLVVVGSAHPASRRQLAVLRERATGPVAVLHTPEERGTDPAVLLALLVEKVWRAVTDGGADGLVLTGGETAAAVLDALGADGVELHDEPEPGIARGTLHAPGRLPRLPVLVKAGGFGDDEALLRLHALLTEAAAAPGR
ncbi:four-carbon acid sugar kinase family protein [Streptomyces roseicoloratus]|uniref:Four-carbon acid sugar kinase family protein n=1 Tax=Streptomyces roseicoloratus TaxID=2508722 RepID=A0ABY9RRA4_9ACTN|nr:four-carbon acid sugar kinase family protein [Streptomyces roseicoloratus]WMX44712.1 four-carbon acid sugar kinase family protein [Streptomyces roseicoloratus]